MKLGFRPRSPKPCQPNYLGGIAFGVIAIAVILSGCNESGTTQISDSPTVRSTIPTAEETDIAVDASVAATFNTQMDPSSIHDGNFRVVDDTGTVSGELSYTDSTVTFNPSGHFAENTVITAWISADVTDMEGNSMDEDYKWSFTTGGAKTVSGPVITETNPSDGATDIPISTAVVATFDDTMDASTVNTATFLLRLESTSTNIAGEVDYSGTTAVFTPSNNLRNDQTYRATITNSVQNVDGNPLDESYQWQFETEEYTDSIPPEVSSTDPHDNENDIPTDVTVRATFSEQMDPATITDETFTLSAEGSSVSGSVEYSENRAFFDPASDLEHETEYTARISGGAQDRAGNALSSYQWRFTTEDAPDLTPPEVVETNPGDDDDDVSENVTITAEFNEPLDPATVNDETVILEQERFWRNREIEIDISYSANTITIDPERRLNEDDYIVTLTTGITDVAGNAMSDDYQWKFEVDD